MHKIGIALVVSLLLAALAFLLFRQDPMEPKEALAEPIHGSAFAPRVQPEPARQKPIPPVPSVVSPFGQELHSTHTSPIGDLKTLHNILQYYALEDGKQMPFGTNQEITRALITPDQRGHAYLSPNHPAINLHGEIVDRWKSPVFFHALSSKKMEIRSAGPDKNMYTKDDLLWPEAMVIKRKSTFIDAVQIH